MQRPKLTILSIIHLPLRIFNNVKSMSIHNINIENLIIIKLLGAKELFEINYITKLLVDYAMQIKIVSSFLFRHSSL